MSGIDPRDQVWEVPHPKYRVHFHDADGTSSEYEVVDAAVDAVLQEAQATRGDRTFVRLACVTHGGLGLLRLLGRDPGESCRASDQLT